ncbi:MAG TPA: hypothetical protein VF571_20355 [Pyrinomonadaceae bacterium]|jgi:hypothetical protein
MNLNELFNKLYNCSNESDVDNLISKHSEIFVQENWFPYGNNEWNLGVIGNQQENSVAALVEKLINSIDAILMRRCYEQGINPKSQQAPKSIEEAVETFFPNSSSWDLSTFRKKQAESIQIIADGPKMDTSLVIYDDGEGQHPENFETTFLSLLRGNKNEIPFVQGKYNMGGSGALVFCGKKRFQLLASKRYDRTGKFGFTLIRKHPFSESEKRKDTFYEFLKINGKIPSFEISELDLGLHNRKFKTGTIIKLYSYDLPSGSRSVISRDLNQSINEYLFQPALPIYTIDTKERYPDDTNLQRELFGLKRRLEAESSKKYVEDTFSININKKSVGEMHITCYVFNPLIEDKNAKESREAVQREFFKNNMAVLFSLNGQVHGHYTSEFITRSLKYPLFRDSLLIHVDCSKMEYDFRSELFMASRDRLKGGEESRRLRDLLASALKKSPLDELYKRRKEVIAVGANEANDLLKSFTRNLPLNNDLLKLLNQTFKLEEQKPKGESASKSSNHKRNVDIPFKPNRFPTSFKFDRKNDGETPIAQIPLGSERTLKFITDVENDYFDRTEDSGELQIALLDIQNNNSNGGKQPPVPRKIEELINVVRTSPHNGTIKVTLSPTRDAQVGDAIRLKVTLSSAGKEFDEIFWIKIVDKEGKIEKSVLKDESAEPMGLPQLIRVYKEQKEGCQTWNQLESQGITMNYETIMHPLAEGEKLETIFINMDSSVFKDYRSKLKGGEEQYNLAEKKYLSAVYFHTLFLYTISKNRNYGFIQAESNEPRELSDYLKDLFQSYYATFLLNFGAEQLIQSLE